MSWYVALHSAALLSQRYRNTHFQLIQWEPFPLQLRCAALRVAIDIETPIVFLYATTIVHYRSLLLATRSGNRPLLQCLGRLSLLPPWDGKMSISSRAPTVLNSSSRQSCSVSTNVTSALEVSLNNMRYIHSRFAYFTYLLSKWLPMMTAP